MWTVLGSKAGQRPQPTTSRCYRSRAKAPTVAIKSVVMAKATKKGVVMTKAMKKGRAVMTKAMKRGPR